MTEGQIFSRPARPNSVNKYIVIRIVQIAHLNVLSLFNKQIWFFFFLKEHILITFYFILFYFNYLTFIY